MSAPCFAVDEQAVEGRHRLRLAGELTLLSAPTLRAAVRTLSARRDAVVTLDLRLLKFIDSSGIRAILEAQEHCGSQGWEFQLIAGPPEIQSTFAATGLTVLLPFVDCDPSTFDLDAEWQIAQQRLMRS